MSIRAAIFDLDGTLLDSLHVWEKVDADFLSGRGIAIPPDYVDAVGSMGFRDAAEYTITRFGLTDTPEDLMHEWNEMAVYEYGHSIRLKPHAEAYLRNLRQKGIKLAVATGLPRVLYAPALENIGITSLFDTVCGVEDAGRSKPHPAVFLLATSRLGVKPGECAIFEDDLAALAGAKRVGMRTYGVYDAASTSDWEAMQRIADGVVLSFAQAPDI